MKSTYFVLMVAILLGVMKSESCAQKISTLEDFGDRIEKLWEVTIPIPPNPNHPSGLIYAPLKSGIAVLSLDGQTIYCYGYDGKLKWQASGTQNGSFYGSLQSSADGEYLYLSYAIHEDVFNIAVYNAAGQLLWSATYDSPFEISPSGKYLIAIFDALDYSMPLTVLDLATGKTLWKLDVDFKHSYWQAAAGQNDKIAYYSGGKLKFFELKDGKLLWEKPVEFDPRAEAGEVHISDKGNVVAFNCFLTIDDDNRLRPDPKSVAYIFDESGTLLWHRIKTVIPQKSNGGKIEGIAEGGEYVAISDGARLLLYDIKTQKELWTIIENGLNLITVFTKELLAFYPREEKTKILLLKKDGIIDGNYYLNQFTDFNNHSPRKQFSLEKNLFKAAPIVVQKKEAQFVLTKFNMKFDEVK